jgi:hypothetical protein
MSGALGTGNTGAGNSGTGRSVTRRMFRRAPWESASTAVIVAGILMLVQPFALALYTYSFLIILAGSVAFVVTSHFPE